MTPLTLWAIYAAGVGLIVGSYLNVLIHRLPRGESTVLPRSRCPACGQAIRPWDNVPVLSYLLLGGRCRGCRARISWRYPLVELATGVLFLASLLVFGPTISAAAAAVFCALSLALALIDVEHFLLPDKLTLPGIVLGLAFSSFVSWTNLRDSLLGAGVGAGVLLALYWGWLWLRREEGMGLGDVKMIALQGAFLGWKGMLLTLLLGALSGSVVGLALLRRQSEGLKTRLPFGTFLALGGLAALFVGRPIIAWYAGFFE